ncbi:MAG: hypothetical protein GY845_30190 [Planctomycetes bacterium]|nr:hypothetical protein [Planctomycetota bacterium]
MEVPVLRFNTYNEQGKKSDQADGGQENTILQRLQTQVHAQESKACSIEAIETMDIIKLAFEMTAAVQRYVDKVRRFYYWVMLLGYCCPGCGGSLAMVAEGRCKCTCCQNELDPTMTFQRCSACGSASVLRLRRYQCRNCGGDIASKFLFDGTVFDADYFRQKMSESRLQKKQQHERVRQMLAESRSASLPLQPVDLNSVPGLVDALNGLTAGLDTAAAIESHDQFDLKRYETHIQAHVRHFPVNLLDIPPLREDARKDLIWRFVAVIFLAHTGIIDIWQDGQDIMVIKHETNREGRGVFGEFEEADRVEGSLGGIEA